MASKKKRNGIIGVVAVIVIVVLLVIFIVPLPPHFGYVSESQVNSATGSKFTSSSDNTNFTGFSGAKSAGYRQYGSGDDMFLVAVAEYNTSSQAAGQFINISSSLSTVTSLSGLSLLNVSDRGFSIVYGSADILTFHFLVAIGRDSNFLFLLVGELPNGNASAILTLARDQASAMTAI